MQLSQRQPALSWSYQKTQHKVDKNMSRITLNKGSVPRRIKIGLCRSFVLCSELLAVNETITIQEIFQN